MLLHIGNKIRLNRKLRRVSLSELADRIHKSKGTVSKYESGSIALDIATLYQIADALSLPVTELLYYGREKDAPPSDCKSPFGNDTLFHVYSYGGKNKINYSLLELESTADQNGQRCKFYYRIPPPWNIEQCEFFYSGHMSCHDTLVTFSLRNEYNAIERLQLCFVKSLRKSDVLTGMLAGLSADLVKPLAYKVLLARKKIPNNQAMEMLLIDAAEFRQFKKSQIFAV